MSIHPPAPLPGAHHEVEEQHNVQELHAPIMREKAEPRDGFEPIPPWATPIFGVLLFWGGFYFAGHYADFRPDIFSESGQPLAVVEAGPKKELSLAQRGAILFNKNCATCHMESGEGKPGQIPPLNRSEWVQQRSPAVLSRILLHGLNGPVTVRGNTYSGVMPSHLKMKDEEIAALLTYVRQAWENRPSGPAEVTPYVVAAARKATAGRAGPWTAAELLALPDDHVDPPVAPPPPPPGNKDARGKADRK